MSIFYFGAQMWEMTGQQEESTMTFFLYHQRQRGRISAQIKEGLCYKHIEWFGIQFTGFIGHGSIQDDLMLLSSGGKIDCRQGYQASILFVWLAHTPLIYLGTGIAVIKF